VVVHQASASQHSVQATLTMMMVIFMVGMCVGCCVQWALRRACHVEVRVGRPLLEYRPPAPTQPTEARAPTPPPPPAQVTATAAAKAASRAAAKAAVAKAKATPKAKAQTRPDEAVELRCPLCEAPMRFKWAGRGGCFWGCSEFPICRGSRRP
jgi:pyruvate/2-oxoglutarate dehydrogenase complex dihydrolipoamide acyltransferase (E2) component